MPQKDPGLQKLIDDLKTKKFREGEAKGLIQTIGEEIKKQLGPLFSAHSKEITDSVKGAFKDLKIDVPKQDAPQVNMPEFPKIPDFPEQKAPIVHVPAPIVNVPQAKITVQPTPVTFPASMRLTPNEKPFPVIMMDQGGKPMLFPTAGSSGPGFPMQTLDTTNNAIRVSGSFSVTSSNASTQLIDSSLNAVGTAANPINVTFAPSGSQNVNLFDASASSITSHAGRVEDFRGIDTVQLGVINVQSVLNSTVVALGAAGTFTGLAEDVKDFASIAVQVFADQVSATDGLSIQQSADGTNWDITDTYTIPASNGKTFSVQPTSRYFRIVYTNGGTIQGVFRLAATFHYHASQPSSQRSSDAYTNETDLQQFWSFNSHFNGTTWDRQSNQSGVSSNALRVQMATDVVSSVNVVGPIAQGDAATALRVVLAGNSDASVVVNSGTITTVTTLTGITNTIATALIDSSGVQYSGSNPLIVDSNDALGQGDSATAIRIIQAGDSVSSVVVNSGTITTVTTLTGITNSIATVLTDSSGVQYSGSNPVPTSATLSVPQGQGDSATAMRVVIAGNSDASVVVNSGTITTVTTLTGITNTVNVRLDTPDGIVSAANPMQVTLAAGGLDSLFVYQARTTNSTAVADGADVRPKTDKLGRTLTRPLQVRDLTKTAYVTLSTGTEATLLAAVAGAFLDCIWIAFANTSTAAVQVDVRATTAGNIVHSAYVPANSTVGWAPPVPWPQDNQGNNWTVDMGDFTNSNVLITALFTQEV